MKVREAFQILTQGVEMVQYDHSAKGGAKKSKKIVWMVRINTIIVYYCIFEWLLLPLSMLRIITCDTYTVRVAWRVSTHKYTSLIFVL